MTTKTLPEQARIVAGMIALGERIAYGRDADLLVQLATIVEAQEGVITRLQREKDALAVDGAGEIMEAAIVSRGEIDRLTKERDEYAKAADTQAAARKVERDDLKAIVASKIKTIALYRVEMLKACKERDALAAAAKLALDASLQVYATCDWYGDDGREAIGALSEAINTLRQAGVR